MTASEPKLKPLGLLAVDDKGEYVIVPIRAYKGERVGVEDGGETSEDADPSANETGRIIQSPSAEDVRIARERSVDYSLEGRLNKLKSNEVSEKGV